MVQDEGDRKPGSVPPQLQSGDDHSSGTGVADCLKRPNPEAAGEQPVSHLIPPHFRGRSKMGTPPYLVLLRVGFTESRCHHRDWCALTAPFHPYQARCTAVIRSVHRAWRFVFCGTFLRVTPTGRYPAPCSAEPGLSSLRLAAKSDHLVSFVLKRRALFSTRRAFVLHYRKR